MGPFFNCAFTRTFIPFLVLPLANPNRFWYTIITVNQLPVTPAEGVNEMREAIRTATNKAIESMAPFKVSQPDRYNQLTGQLSKLADMACDYLDSPAAQMLSCPDAKNYLQFWFRCDSRLSITPQTKTLVSLLIKNL
jgi:hypothetical protein